MFRVNYPSKVFESKALKQIAKACERAVQHPGSITAIIGEVGVGKTVAIYDALGRLESDGVSVMWVAQPSKEWLRIGGIVNSMIRFFGEEPRRYMDARTEQLRRLLGMESKKHRILLVIDDAHGLNKHTMRALKRLLELGFGRRMGLFSIIMICQPEVYEKFRMIPEIRLRTRKVEMKRMTTEEAKEFIGFVARWENVKIDIKARDLIAQRLHNPLRIASIISRMAEWCENIGTNKITKDMCDKLWGEDIKTRMKRNGITQQALANKLNVSKSAISLALNGKYWGRVDEDMLNEALSDLQAEKIKVR